MTVTPAHKTGPPLADARDHGPRIRWRTIHKAAKSAGSIGVQGQMRGSAPLWSVVAGVTPGTRPLCARCQKRRGVTSLGGAKNLRPLRRRTVHLLPRCTMLSHPKQRGQIRTQKHPFALSTMRAPGAVMAFVWEGRAVAAAYFAALSTSRRSTESHHTTPQHTTKRPSTRGWLK